MGPLKDGSSHIFRRVRSYCSALGFDAEAKYNETLAAVSCQPVRLFKHATVSLLWLVVGALDSRGEKGDSSSWCEREERYAFHSPGGRFSKPQYSDEALDRFLHFGISAIILFVQLWLVLVYIYE